MDTFKISNMSFKIHNRRYTGSKQKLTEWISDTISQTVTPDCRSFCDLFAGTGVVTKAVINQFDSFYLNDFLFSNNAIYKAFYEKANYREDVLIRFKREFIMLSADELDDNYVSLNFGNKFFSYNDAKKIGHIRQRIEDLKIANEINEREYYILLTSLLYSFDRCANTVGHYEAYIKNKRIKDGFEFDLISPVILDNNDPRSIHIYREDSNELVKRIEADVVYIDPPYSSRQYSRFYHVLETIIKWDMPELYGAALKPKPENMSEYCSSRAIDAFRELISDLKCKYIFVSYNNTYNSKSKSSQNKMEIDDMLDVLRKKGTTTIVEKKYNAFNAGKTSMDDHKEFLFITEVQK